MTTLLFIGVWLVLMAVILLFFRGANLKKPYPKPPGWRPARSGEGYPAAPYDGRTLPKVDSGPAAGGMTWLEPPEPIIYPPYPGNGADFPGEGDKS